MKRSRGDMMGFRWGGPLSARLLSARLLSACILFAQPLAAHDFWIDLASYHQVADADFPIRLLIGEAAAPEPWETAWRRIVSLRSYGPGGVIDHQASIRITRPDDPGGATIHLSRSGTHVLAFESYQAENDLPAAQFNAYAAQEGLTLALAKRRQDGTTATRGRELYSRRAKALIQVGSPSTEDAVRPIGQTLELVPERNPYGLAATEPMTVRLLFRGRPLAGAKVQMERLDRASRVPALTAVTDAGGRATFGFAKSGRWRVATVWTVPVKSPRGDFDTIFASLTFGY